MNNDKKKTYAYRLALIMFTLLSKTCTFKYYFPSYSHALSFKQSLTVPTLKESKPKLSSTDNLWREKKNAYNQEKYLPHWQQSLSKTKRSKTKRCVYIHNHKLFHKCTGPVHQTC